MHDLVKRDVMVGRDVDRSFFRDVAADPQRIADRHVSAAVRNLWQTVFVGGNGFAHVDGHRTFGVDGRRVRYDHRGTDVVFIYIVIYHIL